MNMKKTLKYIVGILLLSIIIILAFFAFSFINSASFARFELAKAAQNKDSSICDKYYDYEKIIDSYMDDYYKKIGDNPFAKWTQSLTENLKPTLIKRLRTEIISSFENGVPEKTNTLVLLYNNFRNKSEYAAIKVEKLGSKKEKFYSCSKNDAKCHLFVWEKIDNKWKITGFSYDLKMEDVFGKK